ncbi:MAG: hypothetical protein K2R98_08200 [Gemmataceae bacterium]|nr:hypothetical protein [Gemmataceae bacterium]
MTLMKLDKHLCHPRLSKVLLRLILCGFVLFSGRIASALDTRIPMAQALAFASAQGEKLESERKQRISELLATLEDAQDRRAKYESFRAKCLEHPAAFPEMLYQNVPGLYEDERQAVRMAGIARAEQAVNLLFAIIDVQDWMSVTIGSLHDSDVIESLASIHWKTSKSAGGRVVEVRLF